MQPSPSARPELVAHRGYAKRRPENTISALSAAIEAGARFVEVDVQLSKDRHPFLFHDRTLDRMCATAGPVHARTRAELSKLSCSEPERFGEAFASERIADIPGLVELLRAHGGVFAFVEIKRASIEVFGAGAILDLVLPLLEPVRERVALISFSLPFLSEARRRTPLPLGAVFDSWGERASPEAAEIGAEYLFCDVDGLPASGDLESSPAKPSSKPLSKLGSAAKIALYEVADPALAIELGRRGAALVETFAIGEMLAAFRDLDAGSDGSGGSGGGGRPGGSASR